MVKGKVKERRKPSRGGQECVNVSSKGIYQSQHSNLGHLKKTFSSWLQGKWDVLPCVIQDFIKYAVSFTVSSSDPNSQMSALSGRPSLL